mmetsp:Transcript_12081/g.14188  ORF Transcript_12081/g.14188 Transcript_12081/m.14188 type:complete len:87 (+) Transcript_12081:263-523(+)
MAFPHSRGHTTKPSNVLFISPQQLKHDSNGINMIHNTEQKKAMGQARTQSKISQRSPYMGFPAIINILFVKVQYVLHFFMWYQMSF